MVKDSLILNLGVSRFVPFGPIRLHDPPSVELLQATREILGIRFLYS